MIDERYKGNFWSLKELRDYARKHITKILKPEQEMLDDSNKQRMEKKQEIEKHHKMLYPASGNVRLRGVKGNNGCKLIKKFSS